MNRATAQLLLGLCLGMVITACRRSPDLQHLSAMDGSIQHADSLARRLGGVDTSALAHALALFAGDRPEIEARFQDTLRPEEATALGNYHRLMAVALPRALQDLRTLDHALDSTRTRLWQLHHDVEHTLYPREEEAAHVEHERRYLTDLDRAAQDLLARITVVERDHAHYRTEATRSLTRTSTP